MATENAHHTSPVARPPPVNLSAARRPPDARPPASLAEKWLRKLASRIRPRVGPGYQDCLHNHVSARLPSSGPGNHPLDDMFVFFQGAYAPVMWRVWAGGAEAPQGTQKKNSRAGNRKPKTRLPRTKVSLNLTNDTVHLFVSRMWDWDRVWSGSVN